MNIAIRRIKNWLTNPSIYFRLDLSRLQLTQLPPIPTNCTSLDCTFNCLTELPDLPDIIELLCSHNQLTSLPALPKCKVLYCRGNKLSKLPELPNCIDLLCSDNLLEKLPDLPNCTDLWCENNLLTSLPELNKCKKSLKCSDNHIKYLPKIHPYCDLRNIDAIKYIYITKKQAQHYSLKEKPNYHKHIKVIQRSFRRYLRKKYQSVISNYLFAGPTKIVAHFLT